MKRTYYAKKTCCLQIIYLNHSENDKNNNLKRKKSNAMCFIGSAEQTKYIHEIKKIHTKLYEKCH